MRDFSNDHRWLSLNTATVRKQGFAVDDEEARLISPCGGLLSHEMRRQRVVEKVGGERHGLEKTVFEACPCAKGEFLPLFRGMPS